MESIRLFIIRIILTSIILSFVLAASSKDIKHNHYIQPTVSFTPNEKLEMTINLNKTNKNKSTHTRKARGAYRRNWSKSHPARYNNMPPYLVFNRKTGSYHPYYTYPKENSIRRSGVQDMKKWSY